MSRILRRSGVDDDFFDLAAYLLDNSEEAAHRFVNSVQLTLKELAQRPLIGSRKEFSHPALAEVRSWWIKGFPNYLIYYIPLPDGIDILAVLHGTRDVETELESRS